MSNCVVKGRKLGSHGEPSILLEEINRYFTGLKRSDGSNPVYDYLRSDEFFLRWGGNYEYKTSSDPDYNKFQRVERLYQNKENLYNVQGEPKLYIDGTDAYVINHLGEKIFLNETSVKEQDRLDIGNGIALSIITNDPLFSEVDDKDRTPKKLVSLFLNSQIRELDEVISTSDALLEDENLTEDEIEDILNSQEDFVKRSDVLKSILNTNLILRSIEGDVRKRLEGIGTKHDVDEIIEEQDENEDINTSFDDIANHIKESNQVRDTENIDADILKLLSSIVDFTIDRNGKVANRYSELMGDRFLLSISPNKVKNRIVENVANIIEIELSETGEFISSYDSMIKKLNDVAKVNRDELLNRFLDKLNTYTNTLSEQDKFAFQVKFFKAFSKAQQNFILSEMNNMKDEEGADKLVLTYIDPSDIQNKSYTIGQEIFNNGIKTLDTIYKSNPNYLDPAKDTKEVAKLVKLKLQATTDSNALQMYFLKRGLTITKSASDYLVNNADNLAKVLKLNNKNYTLDNLLKEFSENSIEYTIYNTKTKKYDKHTRSYIEVLKDYNTYDKVEQLAITKAVTDVKFDRVFAVLGSVEAIFRTDITDSNFNIAGKSRWKYSLMGGINKEILRWKSGNKQRLENLSNRGIPYVDYLLANRPEDAEEITKTANVQNISEDIVKNNLSNARIEKVEPVIFAQVRHGENVVEYKTIGENDMHLDFMFKLLNHNDEIYDLFDKYQGKNQKQMDEYTSKKGKNIMPVNFNADKGSTLAIKGLVDSMVYASEISGLIKDGETLDLNGNAKRNLLGLLKGEVNSALSHQNIILNYFKIPEVNKVERQNYLMENLIPEVHYKTKLEITNTVNGKEVKETFKFNPEQLESDTNVLHPELIQAGTWNKLGIFNSLIDNYPDSFTILKTNYPISKNNSLNIFVNDFDAFFNEDYNNNDNLNISEALFTEVKDILDYNYEYLSNLVGDNLSTINTNIKDSNSEQVIKNYALNSLINDISIFNMFNGELMFFKQQKNSQSLTMEDALKRGPAPSTDGLQYNIIDTDKTLYVDGKKFYSATKEREDNYLDFNGNQKTVDRNKQVVVSVVTNLDGIHSRYVNQISEVLGKDLNGYEHEIADAGAYITLGMYKRTMLQVQAWSAKDEKMFQELQKSNTKLTDEHFTWLKQSGKSLQPLKLVGYDLMSKETEDGLNNIEVPVFLKFAPAILIDSIVKGTDVEKLLKKMDNDGVDLVVFKSGSKVANPTLTTIHNTSDNNFTGLKDDMKLNPFTFNLSNLKWQVELPTHFFSEGNIGTQHLKNLLANLDLDSPDKAYEYKGKMIDAQEMFDVYNGAVVNILKEQFKNFKYDYGIDFNEQGINYKSQKLRDLLIDNLDASEDFHIISLLRNSENPLETIPGVAQRLFPVLASFIKKNVGKVNTNVGSVIQVANIGFDRLTYKERNEVLFLSNDPELTPPKPITVLDLKEFELDKILGLTKSEVDELKEYRTLLNKNTDTFSVNDKARLDKIKNKYISKNVYYETIDDVITASTIKTDTNKLKINNAKLLIPFADIQKDLGVSWSEFKQIIESEKPNWERGENGKKFDQRIINNIISYRIPNQSISSNDAVTIAGILPPTLGDKAIVYHEITAKAGSDFDVDKLYLMLPSYKIYKNDKTVKYAEKGLKGYQNDLIEAMVSILQSEKTYDDLMSPLDNNIVKDSMYNVKFNYFKLDNPNSDLTNVTEYRNSLQLTPLEQLSPAYKVKNRVDMTKAKQLVAIMANHITDVPMSQIQKLMLDTNIGFGNQSLYNMYVTGYEGDSEMKITKMVSYFMNAAVDAAKDNYIIEGNFNSYTANAAMVLIRSGIHPEEVFKLLLHPEILRISELKSNVTSLSANINLNDNKLDRKNEDALILKYKEFISKKNFTNTTFDSFLNSINGDVDLLKGYWFNLVEVGKELANDISVSKAEANGAGKNIYQHHSIFNKLEQVKRGSIGRTLNGDFKTLAKLYKDGISKINADDHIFEFIDPSLEENQAKLNEYTMFGVIMNNTLLLTNLLAKNMFIEASDNYRYMVNKISEISGNKLDTSENNIKNISKMLYPIVLSTAHHEIYNMSYTEQSNLVENVNNSLDILKNVNELKDNEFLKLLTFNKKNNLIEFPGYKTLDSRDKNQLKHDFKKLYDAQLNSGYNLVLPKREHTKAISDFTRGLIKYSFIATGFKPSKTSFNEYLPLTYFNETAHGNAIDELLNTLNNNSQNIEELNSMMDSSLTMLAYLNPRNYRYIKNFNKGIDILSNIPVTDEKTIKKLINPNTNNFYPFVSYNVKGSKVLMKLISVIESKDLKNKIIIQNPVYSSMIVAKQNSDDKSHSFLYTGLFNGKSSNTVPQYIKNYTDKIPYFNLPTMLLNSNRMNYVSRLDSLNNFEFTDSIKSIPENYQLIENNLISLLGNKNVDITKFNNYVNSKFGSMDTLYKQVDTGLMELESVIEQYIECHN